MSIVAMGVGIVRGVAAYIVTSAGRAAELTRGNTAVGPAIGSDEIAAVSVPHGSVSDK